MAKITSSDPTRIVTVNVYEPENGKRKVELYLRLNMGPEGAQFGLAIDGSSGMKPLFGAHLPPVFRRPEMNVMKPVVQQMSGFLRELSSKNCVDVIYWAVGSNGGDDIEVVGAIEDENNLNVQGPKIWGTDTQLAPALAYYADKYNEINAAPWSMIVFITDGQIGDLDEVKDLAREIGKEYSEGARGYMKLVLLGIGDVDQDQMDELDDMFNDSGICEPIVEKTNKKDQNNNFIYAHLGNTKDEIDLWDCRNVNSMAELGDVLGEVDFGITIDGQASVSADGRNVVSYRDTVPSTMRFEVPENATEIKINLFGYEFVQPLR